MAEKETKTPAEKPAAEAGAEKPKAKVTPGRIVVASVTAGGKLIKRPAIVAVAAGTSISAHVFMDGAKDGDFCCTQWKTLSYDAGGKTVNSWAWPERSPE